MGFAEFNSVTTNRDFLDRTDILKLIEETIISYKNTDQYYKLFTIYGMGGIGKSSLINRLYSLYRYTDLNVYMFSLEILNHETIPAILLHIRKKFSRTPHFDYVLLQYWNYIDYDRIDQKQLFNISQKIISSVATKVDDALFSGLIGLDKIVCTLIKIGEEWGITKEEQNYVEALLHGKPEDLYLYMAQVLAKDIENEIEGQKFVFLFDSYNITQTKYKFDWLKYFINSFKQGLFFVTSREELDWFDNGHINNNLVEKISLNSIPEEIVLEYLLEKNYSMYQASIIISKTECIPLFLDIAMNIGQGNVIDDQFFVILKSKEDLVKYLLSHFSTEEQLIIEYLSVIKLFNQEIYESALSFNRISPQRLSFSVFKKSMIVRYIEHFNNLYKIHTVLANNISFFVEKEVRIKIIKDYIYSICTRILNDDLLYNDLKYNFILNAYRLVEKYQIVLTEDITEKLIDMFFYLLDRGYSNDFANDISLTTNRDNGCLKYIYQYIDGKMTRATNIIKGLYILEDIPVQDCNFGRHQKSLQCDINYLLSISGKYNEAEEKMSNFVINLQENDFGQRYYTKGILYDCDMKMLRGRFESSVEGLMSLSNQVNDRRMQLEIKKAIGHNYRFNFLFEDSIKYYFAPFDEDKYLAYFYTVSCETNCYFNPKIVFEIYEEAIEKNKKNNNYNNLGKIYYAMAIAYIQEHQYMLAQKYIRKAHKAFNQTKYLAGHLFVMLTEAYLEYSQKHNISLNTVKKIKSHLSLIDNIYEYLLLPIYIARNDILKINEYRNKFEWLSFDATIQNIDKFISRL